MDDFHVGSVDHLGQRSQQVAVGLHGQHMLNLSGQGPSERPQARADLDHRILGIQFGGPDHGVDGVGVDHKVLTHSPAGSQTVAVQQVKNLGAGERHRP